jgi:hypothetical protein
VKHEWPPRHPALDRLKAGSCTSSSQLPIALVNRYLAIKRARLL